MLNTKKLTLVIAFLALVFLLLTFLQLSLIDDASPVFHRQRQINYYGFKHQPIPHRIFQTWKTSIRNDNTISWQKVNPLHGYAQYNDEEADEFVRTNYDHHTYKTYASLPRPILKADFFRYLVIYKNGGVYSDIDTKCLKPISFWTDQEPSEEIGLIVALEADASQRPKDLNRAWCLDVMRKIQFVQWTFAARPGHPVLGEIIGHILRRSTHSFSSVDEDDDIIEWTGPGSWTDVIFDYLDRAYNATYHDVQGIKHGKRIGDVYILPLTAFSPGVAIGAKDRFDPEAKVLHHFYSSWRKKPNEDVMNKDLKKL